MRELIQAGYGYALSLTGVEADAEDLVHEAYLRLARRGRRHPDRPLLFTTIDAWRRQRRFPSESLEEESHPAPGPTEDLHLDRVDLTQALSQLRSEEREAIYLQVVQGYTAAEAAELMERPRGTVLSLVHRGKARLRMLLRDQARQEDR
ncbi:MAG: RNA polymerase sigma factor [Gemmatimonadetes bacterium]|nr:RNA polymerase sigma factor [Gemmatimonadota bacterium]